MGYYKELWIQMQDDPRGVVLAEVLGISYTELGQLKYEIQEISNSKGDIINYVVQFTEASPREILDKINRLEGVSVKLDPSELDTSEEEYYEEQFEAITSEKDSYENFLNNMSNLKMLILIQLETPELEEILYRQIFISAIGNMETFLSDAFINLTMENEDNLINFVETHPEFKKRTIPLKEIYVTYSGIKETAKKIMIDTIYHDLPKIREMYTSTFKIEFPDLKELMKLVSTRHDLVHRTGKTKDGELAKLSKENIELAIKLISEFITEIASKLNLMDPQKIVWQ